MVAGEDLLVCKTCGTQYDVPRKEPLKNCRICDDPRQFVPPGGQVWTSLAEMKGNYNNKWTRDSVEKRMTSISTEPKFGIGQRAILLETPEGNILWDLIAYIDDETIDFINSKGGLKAIVISHPHYYTTHAVWSKTFKCPVYVSAEDKEWMNFTDDKDAQQKFITGPTETLLPDVTAIKTGGHFDGSLVLHWENKLFIADTLVIVPSALYHVDRQPGTTSYSFMWSIPNMIPLPPHEVHKIWKALKPFEFDTTYGAFDGLDVRGKDVKQRVLESMKIQVKYEGWKEHEIFEETC